jgi:hypothetical protein
MAAVKALPRILDWIEQEKARLARDGGVPIRIVDYSVLLPQRALGVADGTSAPPPSGNVR